MSERFWNIIAALHVAAIVVWFAWGITSYQIFQNSL